MTTRALTVATAAVALAAIGYQPAPLAQAAQPRGTQAPTAMTLDVDATQAPQKILHATMTMPARAGASSLFYAKWIPGEHMPSGPVWNLTGLHVLADGAEIQWRRDLVEMNAFHVTVPAGAKTLTASTTTSCPPAEAHTAAAPQRTRNAPSSTGHTVVAKFDGREP